MKVRDLIKLIERDGWRLGRFAVRYLVLFEHSDSGWSAYVPDLPGCIATGKSKAETEQLMREAIEFHLEGMRMHGETVPGPTTEAEYVSVPA